MKMEASVDPQCRGPDWMPITPKTGSLFHAETHIMAERLELARLMVRRGASFDADEAWWHRQDVAALQPAPNDHLAAGINPMNLENRLGDV